MFILFPVARSVLTFLRKASFLKCVVPFDNNLTFHRFFGYICEYHPALVLIAFCSKRYACRLPAAPARGLLPPFQCWLRKTFCECACSYAMHVHNLDDSQHCYAVCCSVHFLLDSHLCTRGQLYQSGKPQGHTTFACRLSTCNCRNFKACQTHTTAH